MEQTEKKPAVGYICAISFALIVGLVSMANKICVVYGMPILIVAVRYVLAAAANFAGHHTGLFHVRLRGKRQRGLLVLSAFCYVGSYLLQVCGLMYAPSVLNGILLATVPIWSEIMAAVVLKEKTTLAQNGFLLLSACSVIAMFLYGSLDGLRGFSMRGFLILFVSCIFEAANNIIIRSLKEEYTPAEISYVSCLISSLICLLILGVQMGIGAVRVETILLAFQDWKFVAAILFLGLLGTFLAGVLRGYTLQHMSAIRATVWYNVSTPVTVLAGVLFLKEPFHLYQLVCTAGILIGVLGTQIARGQKQIAK